jgi:hypothetical protein
VKGSTGFDSAAHRLARILEIARRQRELLARGDLDAVQALQEERQRLLAGIQSLDEGARDVERTRSGIQALDKQIRSIVLSEMAEINEKMKISRTLRRLLRSRSSAPKRPSRHLSRHA